MDMKDLMSSAFAVSLFKKLKREQDEKIDSALRFAADLQEEIQKVEGPRGPVGPQGPKGDRGERGKSGPKGDTGERGPKGDQGDRGEQGLPGADGARGEKGEKGDTGLQGVKGDKGDTGDIGPQGIQGPQGERGEPGPTGPQGERGERGEQGAEGPRGEKGERGERGEKGDKGERGDIGPQGPVGPQGPEGPQGPQGEMPDITPVEKKVDEHLKIVDDTLDALNTTLEESFQDYTKQSSSELKKIEKDLKSNLERMFNSYKTTISNEISKGIGSYSGGGSVRILDNDDVAFSTNHIIEGDAILIYDKDIKKFRSESFLSVLDRLKAELEVQYNKLIDVVGNYTYIGEAVPGTATNESVWRIKRIEDVDGQDINIVWAEGTADFVQSWDNRLLYTYS